MTDELFSVRNQNVLVSGGTRGIGRAIAAGFAARGARVALTGRRTTDAQAVAAELTESLTRTPDSQPLQGIGCDVSDPAEIERLVKQLRDQWDRVDTLVNVAGVNRRKPALEVSAEDYDFIMNTNLRGAFQLSQQIGGWMIEQSGGNQINIASLNTDRPLKNVAPYAMSKAAMGHMTRVLAVEWGPHGVRVNALAPGFILTDLTEKLWSDPEMQRWGKANTPQGRLGRPEDMVGTAIFLASPAAAFMTGQTLYVDGGYTAGWAWPIPE